MGLIFKGPEDWKNVKIALQDWILNLDWKISSEPPAQTPISYGELRRSGLKFSIEIELFKRDWKNSSEIEFFSILGPLGIGANRFADSRESPDSRELFQGSQTESLFCESRFGRLKIANRRFEAIHANRSHLMLMFFFCSANRFVEKRPRFALQTAGPSKLSDSGNRL